MEIEGTIRTVHGRPGIVAASISPDNLHGMDTRVTDGSVTTTIRAEKVRSMIASIDDYLMNLGVAEDLCRFDSH